MTTLDDLANLIATQHNFASLTNWLALEKFVYLGTSAQSLLSYQKGIEGKPGFFAVKHNYAAVLITISDGSSEEDSFLDFTKNNGMPRLLVAYTLWMSDI